MPHSLQPTRTQRRRTRKKVEIVGLGGIGHFGALFAKALGAISSFPYICRRSRRKETRGDGFIAIEDKDWDKPHKLIFDIIVNTASGCEGFDLSAYLGLLDLHGRSTV